MKIVVKVTAVVSFYSWKIQKYKIYQTVAAPGILEKKNDDGDGEEVERGEGGGVQIRVSEIMALIMMVIIAVTTS